MSNLVLPEFQEFLVSEDFVSKDKTSYYAYWVSKFLDFSNHDDELPVNMRIKRFLKLLSNEKSIEDWQVKQAQSSLQLYLNNFLKNGAVDLEPNTLKEPISIDIKQILDKVRKAIRLKHYAYKTERSYTDWVKRFYNYVFTGKVGRNNNNVDSNDVKDFLSHLAIDRRVASSTQNQAFNALLFLFREVLNVELKDMAKVVRAKRGPKLPVVLTIKEVQQLFKCVEAFN